MSAPPAVVLGITDSINSGAAVLVDGRIVAAVSEERLCRIKLAMGWPRLAIAEVMRIAGILPTDVDAVAVATKDLYWRPEARSIDGYFDAEWGARKSAILRLGSWGSKIAGDLRLARLGYYQLKRLLTRQRRQEARRAIRDEVGISAPVTFIDHHLAHAATAYYTGGGLNAAVVTLDGAGDHLSATVSAGQNGTLRRVHAVDSYDSVGNFYSYVTHILGFQAHKHEGKITGLAAYGKPIYLDSFRQLVCHEQGEIRNRSRAFHLAAIEKVRGCLPSDARREDVAASIQQLLEEVCVGYVSHWVDRLGLKHLCVAGGVVANVKLNQRLLEIDDVDSIFVHPGMGDDGLAVGAALSLTASSLPERERAELVVSMEHAYLGPSYSDLEIKTVLDREGVEYRASEHLADEIADCLARKKVVARFDGAMEYGPRALGNRSILVHAGDPTINNWLNKRLERTEFMPFAPVTLAEEAPDCYLGLKGAEHTARFMTITTDCTRELAESCPAVVHVDGTARPQLIPQENDCEYRKILEQYRQRTGYSTIINTSFNMHEEPIVCTPEDAVRAFKRGNLDYLAIGPFLAPHPEQAKASAGTAATEEPA